MAEHEIHALIRARKSSRLYDAGRRVDPHVISLLLEAARWAPSSRNAQPWRYLVFDDRVPLEREQARACLDVANRQWADRAPVLILAVSEDEIRPGRRNPKAQHDLGLANANLLLQATALGLSCRPMGGFDARKAQAVFKIPEAFTPTVMIAVGYPDRGEGLPAEVIAREQEVRPRRDVTSFAYLGEWERGHPG
jgi:nitroreductase